MKEKITSAFFHAHSILNNNINNYNAAARIKIEWENFKKLENEKWMRVCVCAIRMQEEKDF